MESQTFIDISITDTTTFIEFPQLSWKTKLNCFYTVCFTKCVTTSWRKRANGRVIDLPKTTYQDWNFPHTVGISEFPVSVWYIQLATS